MEHAQSHVCYHTQFLRFYLISECRRYSQIAAAFIAGAMVVMPSATFASDLSTPVIEKRAKFSIGAGIQNSADLEKRAKFSIGAGIQKSQILEKRAKFSIGAGIQNSAELEKRAKFSIGAGIQ
jgi:hypothetical protein